MRNPVRSMAMAVVFGVGLVVSGSLARADEESIPVKNVPKAALDAVKAKFPNAKIKEAAREEEDGKTIYEVTLIKDDDDDEDETIDVSVTAEGKILVIEETIEEEDVPNAVYGGLKKKYPKSEIEKAEKVTENGKVTYEFLIEEDEDEEETLEVVLDLSGKILKVTESDEEKGEKGEKKEKKGEKKEKKEGKKEKKDKKD